MRTTPRWEYLESQIQGKRNYYGRFSLSTLKRGQGTTIGFLIRRILLAEVLGPSVTYVKFEKLNRFKTDDLHEFSTIPGIQESIHEIIMNLQQIVFRTKTKGLYEAKIMKIESIGKVTAKHIVTQNNDISVVDPDQYLFTLTELGTVMMRFEVTSNRGYYTSESWPIINPERNGFGISIGTFPIENVNFSIVEHGDQESLFLEISTNGSLTPKEALLEASKHVINLFNPFTLELLDADMNLYQAEVDQQLGGFQSERNRFDTTFGIAKYIGLEQLDLSPRIYNCLIRHNVKTAWDLLNKATATNLQKMDGITERDIVAIQTVRYNLSIGLALQNFRVEFNSGEETGSKEKPPSDPEDDKKPPSDPE
uniref:DNA-directed RNA polymerase n=1 Tax=Passiflora filipes TaxID=298520 RepID=A0A4Y5QFX3_9ROSI|nr:RNA polymerase alpha subunit [Passiflora filipes]YP_009671279.1 RNA polymerase alpha subunit [Passiflora filipes]QCX30504.1 RNA polymerase alpha subunit [Passiflora filipes]QCX30505.1 RNA polymerase alpha subunit [Passiflora filipes]